MKSIVFALPGNEKLATKISAGINGEMGEFVIHQFPDEETYVRVLSDVAEKDVIVTCTLHKPNNKLLPLFFLCKLLKELRAKTICLVAPYLAYMRQDKQFNPGEAITSAYFAELLSSVVDHFITVDPHLHRRSSMNEIYTIPYEVLHAAGLISGWIKENIPDALLVGPDKESEQWVAEVAKSAGVPFIVLQKHRRGDKDVEVSVPHVEKYKDLTPVLVDDIISTARTMIETIRHLNVAKMKAPVCIGVHAVFAGDAFKNLIGSGAREVITCNTILHETNRIDVSDMIINKLKNQ